ncbi:MAG: hypothetical protein P0107_05810 [Nitrosomonas sp.]|nr:hypothetical protein [Nitrosomonas sp.]
MPDTLQRIRVVDGSRPLAEVKTAVAEIVEDFLLRSAGYAVQRVNERRNLLLAAIREFTINCDFILGCFSRFSKNYLSKTGQFRRNAPAEIFPDG